MDEKTSEYRDKEEQRKKIVLSEENEALDGLYLTCHKQYRYVSTYYYILNYGFLFHLIRIREISDNYIQQCFPISGP